MQREDDSIADFLFRTHRINCINGQDQYDYVLRS